MSLYDILKKLDIDYHEVSHVPVYTVQQAQIVKNKIDGLGCKNLFLTDNKKYYLVILKENKRVDLKELSTLLKTSRLSFASEGKLNDILGLLPGNVTPFGIINDNVNRVTLLIDNDLRGNKLLFHPNINTKTLSIMYDDLIKFIEYENHEYLII